MWLPRSVRLRRAAHRHFGWSSLRDGQLAAMRAVARGRDALVVMPTGAGKSAIYQVPGTLAQGPTLVISPLLALQEDQVAALEGRADERLRAVRISSVETPNQRAEALAQLADGRARFLFITPEQLAQPERLAEVRALRPALVAVDEAHCISSWGFDFRPDYLALGQLIDQLGRPPVVALTATASPPVREDIIARLRMRDPRVVLTGLDRANLHLSVVHCPTEELRWQRLLGCVTQLSGAGIVYTPTRRAAEELAQRLTVAGHRATYYHGGLAGGERTRRHREFLGADAPIMVATSAFGMGIDKPDIRWVLHLALPDSPDSYLQEIGRAGRDGLAAQVILLWRAEDVALQRYYTGGSPDRDELVRLATVLQDGPLGKTVVAQRSGLGPRKLGKLLALLEQVGAAATTAKGQLTTPRYAPAPAAAATAALAEHERYQQLQRSRIDMMRSLAETTGCRGQALLAYFGEHAPDRCGHCDNCQQRPLASPHAKTAARASAVSAAAPLAYLPEREQPWPIHSQVEHSVWGVGMVLRYEAEKITLLFDEVGYKTLSVPVVREQNLLTAVD
jgi:ATP-dependent DNA helicase RecQ